MALGDRKDGKLVKDIDGMHFVCPIIYPNRCDNEAFIQETIDLTNIDKYLKKKNKNLKDDEYKYNLFQIMVTAMLKVFYLRPKMNYFIANGNLYERNEISASFVVKKMFSDNGGEGLAFIHSSKDDNLDTIHQKIKDIVYSQRHGESDESSDFMDFFAKKMPRFLSKFIIRRVMFLDKHGLVPKSLIKSDPYYSSVVISNLGSINLKSVYHHLTNWGTNSVFLVIGAIKKRTLYNSKGKPVIRNTVDIGLTIDERLADGYYYSKTIELLKELLQNPELLEDCLNAEVKHGGKKEKTNR